MKFSLEWLGDYIKVDDFRENPQELARILTQGGFEVEAIHDLRRQYEKVVIGQILKKEKHPQADRLTVCQVTTGKGVVHTIVCGAKNHQEQDRVVVALPGAQLPGGILIQETEIRSVKSSGMLCSGAELGLEEESEGVLILSEEAPIGESFSHFWGLDDILFEVKVTPNRTDVLSHFGLAQEIGALTGRDCRQPDRISWEEIPKGRNFSIVRENGEDCRVYLGVEVRAKSVPNPPILWQKRLKRLGKKSLSFWVDLTNYCLLDVGQPLHAFDLHRLPERKMVTCRAKKQENFQGLDGKTYHLRDGDLLICNGETPVALAGVLGGEESAVTSNTQSIFLESAWFLGSRIRKTLREHGIETDAGFRFSRGFSPNWVLYGMERALFLIQKHLPDAEVFRYSDPDDWSQKSPPSCFIQPERIRRRLGYPVTHEEIKMAISRVGATFHQETDGLLVTPPWWRTDLEIEEDWLEEVARLTGYDHIPEEFPPLREAPRPHHEAWSFFERVTRKLVSLGYYQIVTPIFLNQELQKSVWGDSATAFWSVANEVEVLNPIKKNEGVLRHHLVTNLIDRMIYNLHQGNLEGRMFEMGACLFFDAQSQPIETQHLAMARFGQAENYWSSKSRDFPLLALKEDLLSVFDHFSNVGSIEVRKEISIKPPKFLHPSRFGLIFWEREMIGFVGELHPSLVQEWKLKGPIALAEWRWPKSIVQDRVWEHQPLCRLPFVRKDLVIVLPKGQDLATLLKFFREFWHQDLKNLELFDLYTGAEVPEGHWQLGFRFVLQRDGETLQDSEVNEKLRHLARITEEKFGAKLPER